jgi:hypothetical protein
MDEQAIRALVKTTIEAQIVKALNEGPELIEKLVKAALAKEVDPHSGKTDGYGNRIPYIDYLVGHEIRFAAQAAVRKVVAEKADAIEAQVRAGLTDDKVVSAFAKAIVGATEKDWAIKVQFAVEDR